VYASLRSIGGYAPEKILSNADLEKMVDTTSEWIEKRTGIQERRIASNEEATSDLGVKAALIAIERAGIDKSEIDLIICATLSPDYFCMPSTACVIAKNLILLMLWHLMSLAACSGFVYMLSIAKSFIESGMKKNILIIGAEKLVALLQTILIEEHVFFLVMVLELLLLVQRKILTRLFLMFMLPLMADMANFL
jgi:3-oxoacyl-[acyl-carrier-protein] synthase III